MIGLLDFYTPHEVHYRNRNKEGLVGVAKRATETAVEAGKMAKRAASAIVTGSEQSHDRLDRLKREAQRMLDKQKTEQIKLCENTKTTEWEAYKRNMGKTIGHIDKYIAKLENIRRSFIGDVDKITSIPESKRDDIDKRYFKACKPFTNRMYAEIVKCNMIKEIWDLKNEDLLKEGGDEGGDEGGEDNEMRRKIVKIIYLDRLDS